ncbi:MAG: porin [Bacteroidia bacterium]|nr:porin [Bacteroidia bacterium]
MKKGTFRVLFFTLILGVLSSYAQDSLVKKKSVTIQRDSTALFGGIGITKKSTDEAALLIGGYVSTYYAYYTDETNINGMVQAPAVAPRNKEFGLNMALISLKYNSKNVRGNFGLHFGDIPKAIWPSELNMIQEANVGFRIVKGLWLDAGAFRSHIGVESTQPRENIATSMSLVDNFEPYYFAGAKLTYVLNSKLSLQLNAFNSFNTLVDYNKDKLFGFSAVYDPNDKISITYNFVTGDETPDTVSLKQRRYYNDLYATMKFNKLSVALEANYGWQENSDLKDTTKNAVFYSGLAVLKYQYIKKSALYLRGEYLSDPNRALTGIISFGDHVMGTTLGVEYKPFSNVALSAEGRILQSENAIFKEKNYKTNQRYEFILCLDVSF